MDRDSLIKDLEQLRGRPLPPATFYKWLDVCGIPPRRNSFYSQQECISLRGLAVHLSHGGTYDEYAQYLIEEKKHGSETTNQARTATVIVEAREFDC